MQHPDEGTIHAWLDGELPPADATALEAHVAGCAACAALVAEARGFLAASSRILAALDDVPAGIVPSARPSAAAEPSSAVASARPALEVLRGRASAQPPARGTSRRPLHRRPEFAAAAALLVVAMGTWSVYRTTGRAPRAASEAPAMMARALDSTAAFSAPPPAAAPTDQAGRADAAPRRDRASAEADVAKAAPPAPSRPAPVATPGAQANERRELAANEATAVANAAGGAASQLASIDTVRAAKSAQPAEGKRMAVMAESVTSVEKRRVADEVQVQRAAPAAVPPPDTRNLRLGEVVTTSAAASTVRQPAAAASGAMGAPTAERAALLTPCYAIARTVRAVAARVPGHLELLDVVGSTAAGREWRQARALGERPEVGTWFWVIDAGRVAVARFADGVPGELMPLTGAGARELGSEPEACPRR